MSYGNAISLRVAGFDQKLLVQSLQVIAASFFIGLCAQIQIPLPFTSVPITLQTFAVLLVAKFLGSKRGAMAVCIYLGEILLGFPMLSGAISLPLALIGPQGGYLLGFVPLAYASGWIFERTQYFSQGVVSFSLILVCFLELLLGSLWLGAFVGLKNVLVMGVIPFIPGEVLKVCALMTILKFRKIS